MIKNHEKVNADLVHQVTEQDVLIYKDYYAFPSLISRKIYEQHIHSKFSHQDLETFNTLYRVYEGSVYKHHLIHNKDFVLRSVLVEINKNELPLDSKEQEIDVLRDNYIGKNDCYILNNAWLNEYSELKILMLTGNKERFIDVDLKIQMSIIFEKYDFPLINKILYTTMFNDTKHPYFYKKKHEHVPGMMIIEAVRQSFYAYFYKFKEGKRGQVSISISSLNVRFYYYTQSNYPLRIMIEESSLPDERNPHVVRLIGKLFQRNRLIGEITYSGQVIKMNVFQRLRVMGKNEEKISFIPVNNIEDQVMLIDKVSVCIHICRLKEISMKGMLLSVSGTENLRANEKFIFILNIKDKEKIIGACYLIDKYVADNNKTETLINFEKLSKNNVIQLSDYIKSCTYINDRKFMI